MKRIILIGIVVGIIGTILLYARIGFAWYVVTNPDGTIHTVEQLPLEKLNGGKVRHDIPPNVEIPQNVDEYNWKGDSFTKKKASVIATEKAERDKEIRIREKIEAQLKLNAISELEKTDSEDYSFEKQKYEKIIEERK